MRAVGIVLWFLVGTYLYLGFFSVDPYYFEGGSRAGLRLLLQMVRIAFPLIWIGACILYALKKPPKELLIIAGAATVVSGIFAYILALNFYYVFSGANSLGGFHPYLQLSPPDIKARPPQSDRRLLRVLFLGGSSTDWPDSTGKEWTTYVQDQLASRKDVEVQTYNAAREWYNSQHSLINYVVNLRSLKPTHVVVMNVINDFMVNAEFSWISAGNFQPDYRHWYGPITRLIKRPSLYASVGEKLRAGWYATPRELVDTTEFPGLEAYREKIKSLVEVIRNDGATPILMTEPYLYRQNLTEAEQATLTMLRTTSIGPGKNWSLNAATVGMQKFSTVVRDVAKESKVALIDLESRIPKSTQYLRDDCHFTDEAFPMIASFVSEELSKEL